MKKFINILIAIVLSISCMGLVTSCSTRDEKLTLYMPGDYIEREIFVEFENWYFAETGKTIKVYLEEFDSLEIMYDNTITNEVDYELFCPSDYMIEELIRADKLAPIDKSIVTNYDDNYEFILEKSKFFDPELKYSNPYMWGTIGVMYDSSRVKTDLSTWADFFGYSASKIYMKKSVRDLFAIGSVNYSSDILRQASNNFSDYTTDEYSSTLSSLFQNFSADMLNNAAASFRNISSKIQWETDEGKIDVAYPTPSSPHLGYFWSCDAGFVMQENSDLRYIIPDEGSGVYIDSFVINKNSKNHRAANMFLQYINNKDVAKANMDYVGSPSGIRLAIEEYIVELQDYLIEEGFEQEFIDNYISMFYPEESILERCAMMKNYTDKENQKIFETMSELYYE